MFVGGFAPSPATIVQVSPANALNWKESTSPVVSRTQFDPQNVSPETMGVSCAGSLGQFCVSGPPAHPEVGIRTKAKRSAANGKLEFVKIRIRFLLDAGCEPGAIVD